MLSEIERLTLELSFGLGGITPPPSYIKYESNLASGFLFSLNIYTINTGL